MKRYDAFPNWNRKENPPVVHCDAPFHLSKRGLSGDVMTPKFGTNSKTEKYQQQATKRTEPTTIRETDEPVLGLSPRIQQQQQRMDQQPQRHITMKAIEERE
mmetsp:Transcript_5619/g.12481  ORF Transcript_5619/g.12481 Transcript_5619/m.12481 type:complete len:102 (+) Transcript_5619:306-611(+)